MLIQGVHNREHYVGEIPGNALLSISIKQKLFCKCIFTIF